VLRLSESGGVLQIAIDGPAASGKTTVARATARRLHLLYLDTGAMYRAVAFLALRAGTDVDNGAALARLLTDAPVEIVLDESAPLGFRLFAGGRELDEETLQSNEVTAIVSSVAKHAEVRSAMVRAQREIASKGPVVMAGRDIGTVVLPDAPVKIYLTASVPARVHRRRLQLARAGAEVESHRLAEEIEERDRLDATRAISPLAPAPDAHVIDSSDVDAEAVVDRICAIILRQAQDDIRPDDA
jgi:CMP/dCMP kinase